MMLRFGRLAILLHRAATQWAQFVRIRQYAATDNTHASLRRAPLLGVCLNLAMRYRSHKVALSTARFDKRRNHECLNSHCALCTIPLR